jgi:hypothetical protein
MADEAPRQPFRWLRISDLTALVSVIGVVMAAYGSYRDIGSAVNRHEVEIAEMRREGTTHSRDALAKAAILEARYEKQINDINDKLAEIREGLIRKGVIEPRRR